ncbi:MAG TPA: hypothetical protein PLL26_02410 [Candidatus Dojkabacteria bacterium]|nr:hypothetical protein [Candidatus Dojkabacteria bacterium]
MQLLTESYNFDIMNESRKALQKIQESKSQKKSHMELIQEGIQKVTVGSEYFEPYDSLLWEGKVKIDMLYFDQFLQKLEETEQIYSALGAYFKNIRQIYEFVNLKPEIYGKGVDYAILEKSNEAQKQILSNVIYEYFDRSFYSLTPEQRKERYLEESRDLAKTLISEGVEPEEAIKFSTKVSIVENLLQKIAFPFSVWSRIKYLTESDDYRKVFDQDALIDLVNSFEKRVHSMSKVVASVV